MTDFYTWKCGHKVTHKLSAHDFRLTYNDRLCGKCAYREQAEARIRALAVRS